MLTCSAYQTSTETPRASQARAMASRWVVSSWALLEVLTYAAIMPRAYQTPRRLAFSLIAHRRCIFAPQGPVSTANTALNATTQAFPTERSTAQKAEFSFALISQRQNGLRVRTAEPVRRCPIDPLAPVQGGKLSVCGRLAAVADMSYPLADGAPLGCA